MSAEQGENYGTGPIMRAVAAEKALQALPSEERAAALRLLFDLRHEIFFSDEDS